MYLAVQINSLFVDRAPMNVNRPFNRLLINAMHGLPYCKFALVRHFSHLCVHPMANKDSTGSWTFHLVFVLALAGSCSFCDVAKLNNYSALCELPRHPMHLLRQRICVSSLPTVSCFSISRRAQLAIAPDGINAVAQLPNMISTVLWCQAHIGNYLFCCLCSFQHVSGCRDGCIVPNI